jgi:hypothetical protein
MSNAISRAEIRIGEARIAFEMPTSLYEMVSDNAELFNELKLYSTNADTIIDLIRSLIPQEHRPPTHKQESYATTISKALGLELTDDILRTAASCSAFISLNAEYYDMYKFSNKERLAEKRRLISQANRVNRWLQAKEALDAGKTMVEVAMDFGVQAATIEKYCYLLKTWVDETQEDNEYPVVMDLVQRQRAGEDIYAS